MGNKSEVLSFDDAINNHKKVLTESLVNFDEGYRVRKILSDVDSNSADYEYYFHAGQQSKQDEIDRIVGIVTEAYKSGGNSSIETIYDKIQELLKWTLKKSVKSTS